MFNMQSLKKKKVKISSHIDSSIKNNNFISKRWPSIFFTIKFLLITYRFYTFNSDTCIIWYLYKNNMGL